MRNILKALPAKYYQLAESYNLIFTGSVEEGMPQFLGDSVDFKNFMEESEALGLI